MVGWRALVPIVAKLTALVAVIAFLALGILFIVLPAMVLGAVACYLLPKRPSRTLGNLNGAERTGNKSIIDGTYRVTNDAAGEAENDHK